MHIPPPIILFGLAVLGYAITQSSHRIKPARFPYLKGWQKIFGIVAVLVVVLMVINPEFLALGVLGDTAFFDAFVLLLSLQLQTVTARTWHYIRTMSLSFMRVMMPRLRFSCAMFIMIFAPIADLIEAMQKAFHRLSS